jgi:phosphoribosyl 1,2-cyclic phosphodiesterase
MRVLADMRVRFWGVRGSVSWATAPSIGHGCNTPCVSVSRESGEILVLDAGSGIVGVGEMLRDVSRPVPIVLSHYHWDHLQGLPFFAPFYQPGAAPTIWAPALDSSDHACVEVMFRSPYFAVPRDQLASPPVLRLLQPGRSTIESFAITAIRLNHPGGAFGYRIAGSRGDLVYATDHELGEARFDEALGHFVAGAAALILDAHFTPEEASRHRGWGHSCWATAARFAAAHDVGRLWLFHHKPGRTDTELSDIANRARAIFPATDVAGEGDTFEL